MLAGKDKEPITATIKKTNTSTEAAIEYRVFLVLKNFMNKKAVTPAIKETAYGKKNVEGNPFHATKKTITASAYPIP